MAALDAIKAGARRKIGNGLDTNVWSMPWLPSVDNGFLITPMLEQLRDITVRNLMEMEANRWDLDVLNDLCDSRDV